MDTDPKTNRFSFADRSDRGKLRLTGPQRAWYLHQITSQSFEDIRPGDSRVATLLTHTGRMVGLFEAVATDDAILCHFEPDLMPEMPEAIRKYVFATQVEIEDVSDEMGLVLVLGEHEPVDLPDTTSQEARLIGAPATYLWVARSAMDDVVARLSAAGGEQIDEDELESIRIANAVPRWGYEMGPKTFPQEAGIDSIAVHYDKGCYTGQEAMAKIHFRGKVNRKLARIEGSQPFERGQELVADGERIGVVTSGAISDARGWHGLALVKHTVSNGARATADDNDVVIEDVG